jgi:CYTH domain-containing protein
MIEKEKRWYLNGELPMDDLLSKKKISQVYSNFSPDVRIIETVENDISTYTHTVKHFINDNDREEIEQYISDTSYNRILKLIDKKPLVKDRFLFDLGNNLIAEVDHFIDTDEWIVEVEFSDDKTMNDFQKPNWFGNEVDKGKQFNKQVFSLINSSDVYSELRYKYSKGGD